jgi:hypothetical protein
MPISSEMSEPYEFFKTLESRYTVSRFGGWSCGRAQKRRRGGSIAVRAAEHKKRRVEACKGKPWRG